MLKKWIDNNLKGDTVIWLIVFAFSIISILVVYSATSTLAFRRMEGNTEYFLFKQIFLIGLGLTAMWVAHKIDFLYYSKISLFALWASVPLLLFAWLYGSDINNASRWINIPVINQSFQPSDLAKLALITYFASKLSKRQHDINNLKESLLPLLLWSGLICGLIALTNISTASVLFLCCLIMLFAGRVPSKQIGLLVLTVFTAGLIALTVGQRLPTAISRITDYMNKEQINFQLEQSYYAIATGGLMGKGPGNSEQRNFLPQPYSDFIYAIIVEEYGMVGGITIVLLYLALLYRGMITLSDSSRAFGGLLAAGLSLSIVIQALINISVVIGLLPVTGLPLPLLSMGGTSILFTGIALGIIQSVSRCQKEEVMEQLVVNSQE